MVGFLTVMRPSDRAAEISWLAVPPGRARPGCRDPARRCASWRISRREASVRLLVVKTLSDREDPGPEYAATRAFYLAKGFRPAAELDLFGPENPIQLMARRI